MITCIGDDGAEYMDNADTYIELKVTSKPNIYEFSSSHHWLMNMLLFLHEC